MPSDLQRQRLSDLWEQTHPHPTTRLGKFGHVMNVIGQDVGMALEPEMMTNIPGTFASKRAEMAGLERELGPQMAREAAAREGQARTEIERGHLGVAQAAERRAELTQGLPEILRGEESEEGAQYYLDPISRKTFPVYPDEFPREVQKQISGMPTTGGAPTMQAPEGQLPYAKTPPPPSPMAAPQVVPGQLRPGDVRGKQLTAEQRILERLQNIATKQNPTAEEQDYYNKHAAQYEGKLPSTQAQVDRHNAMMRTLFQGVPGGKPDAYFGVVGESVADLKNAEAQARADATNLRVGAAPARAAAEKEKHNYGYGVRDGRTWYMTEAEAAQNKSPFEPVPPGQVTKDRAAIGQVGDVQMNVSRYTKAAHDYDMAVTNGRISQAQMAYDQTNLHNLLNKAGLFQMKLSGILEIDIPFISAFGEALSREAKSRSYDMLSEQAKGLYDGYLITVASIPAYQRMLTETGRNNKEMLDLELNTIADPSMGTTAILRRQQRFQDNIDQATKRLPVNLPGLERNMPTDIRKGIESAPPAGATIRHYDPRTGTWKQ